MFVAVATILSGDKVHAASFTVAAGADENTDNSSCALSEAIENINDGAQTNTDCVETGSYGTDDTINLPSGTITLVADLPQVTQSLTVQGQGMGATTVDGDGAYFGFHALADDFSITGLTITGLKDIGILASGGDIVVRNIEVNGANWLISDPGQMGAAVVTGNGGASTDTVVSIENVYVHNFNVNVAQFICVGAVSDEDSNITATISNVTVAGVTNTGITQSVITGTGLFESGTGAGTINTQISNVTVTDVHSQNSTVTGIVAALLTQDTNVINVSTRNVTITNLTGGGSSPFVPGAGGAALAVISGAVNEATVNLSTTNLLIDSPLLANCATGDISAVVLGSGAVHNNLTSLGGNLSDDNSCSSYFTQPTDQNNLTNLASTLAPLADNGGFVPTMALLQNSPAIDSGVTVAGLTTDARKATRPQGTAYDSGAYESPYSKASSSTSTLADTGQNPIVYLLVTSAMLLLGSTLLVVRKSKT